MCGLWKSLSDSSMKILLADKHDSQAIRDLNSKGFQLVMAPKLAPGNIPEGGADCTILVVRSTVVTMALMQELPHLKLIIRAGAGVDTIDVTNAKARGIQVSNCPGKNADAVAEMALALLLAVDRKIVAGTVSLRAGKWNKGALGQGIGLKGRVLGLIGFGAVAQALARKVKGLEMEVIVWSHHLTPAMVKNFRVRQVDSLQQLAQDSDAVSLHIASTMETRNLISTDFFNAMRPGAIFINTARGEIVDRNALLKSIHDQGLRVGLDVFTGEPKVSEADFLDSELAALATCTPHLGASTDQAASAVAAEVVRIVEIFRETGLAPNSV
jgi:D-3-phosphoglycerate dehydrogenase / 2-oxoglutarate reductase